METTVLTPVGSEFSMHRAHEHTHGNESHTSGISWSAVMGGAFVTGSLSLILLALGTGLGLSSVSPWSDRGLSASAVGTSAIVWLIMIQLVASAFGGYLAGRLRSRWVTIHSDEVYFRDTAHGFLSWAVATVVGAAFLASAAAALAGTALQAGATVASSPVVASATEAVGEDPSAYYVDMFFRPDRSATTTPVAVANDGSDGQARAEASRIFINAMKQDDVPQADRTYLGQLVATRTGLSQADADKRVSDVLTQARAAAVKAKQVADDARKAAAHFSLWLFLGLLVGAFSSSLAATFGGDQRDHVVVLTHKEA